MKLFICSCVWIAVVVIVTATAKSAKSKETNADGSEAAPCSNGSAIYHVSIDKDNQLKGLCRPYDNCTRFCYNSPNCTTDKDAPPNKQVFLTAINHTKDEHHQDKQHHADDKPDFRCCASSLRLQNCAWKTAKQQIEVPENKTISDVRILPGKEKLLEAKVCDINETAGQPTAKSVCFADVCDLHGYCHGHHIPQSSGGQFNADSPYGLLALLATASLLAIPTGCSKFLLPTGVTSIAYPNLDAAGKIPIGGVATATCKSGWTFPSGLTTFISTCLKTFLFDPLIPACTLASCPKLADPPESTFAYSMGTCVDQLCPIATVATLMCPAMHMAVETSTSACTPAATCASGMVFTPSQLSCVYFCPPLSMDATLYTVTYSPSNCAIFDKTVATVTCTADKYFPDVTTIRTTTCSNGVLTTPAEQCAATCPLPVIDPSTQQVAPYNPPVAPNGQLLDKTVVTITCISPTDVFSDGTTTQTLTCNSGTLSPAVLPCVKTCPKRMDPTNGVFVYSAGVCSATTGRCTQGSTAQYTCSASFTIITATGSHCATTPAVETCDTTETFLPDAAPSYVCSVYCAKLTDPFGTFSYSDTTCSTVFPPTVVATLSCAPGKMSIATTTSCTSTTTCGADTSFAPQLSCVNFCAALTMETTLYDVTLNPAVPATDCAIFEGTVATVKCKVADNYFPDGKDTLTRTCTNSAFAPVTEKCAITCVAPSIDAATQTVSYSTSIASNSQLLDGTVATITCTSATEIFSGGTTSIILTCSAGALDPVVSPIPSCVKSCPKPTDPLPSGKFDYAAGLCSTTNRCTVATTAQLTCNSGYAAVTVADGSICATPSPEICDASTGQFAPDVFEQFKCVQLCADLVLDPQFTIEGSGSTTTDCPTGMVPEGTVENVGCTNCWKDLTVVDLSPTCSAGSFTTIPATTKCVSLCWDLSYPGWGYKLPIVSNTPYSTAFTTNPNHSPPPILYGDDTTTTITCRAGVTCDDGTSSCLTTCTNGQWTRFCKCTNGYYDGAYNPDGSPQLFQPATAGQYVVMCLSQSSSTDTQCVPLASVKSDFPGYTYRCPNSDDFINLGSITQPTETATTYCVDQPEQFVATLCSGGG